MQNSIDGTGGWSIQKLPKTRVTQKYEKSTAFSIKAPKQHYQELAPQVNSIQKINKIDLDLWGFHTAKSRQVYKKSTAFSVGVPQQHYKEIAPAPSKDGRNIEEDNTDEKLQFSGFMKNLIENAKIVKERNHTMEFKEIYDDIITMNGLNRDLTIRETQKLQEYNTIIQTELKKKVKPELYANDHRFTVNDIFYESHFHGLNIKAGERNNLNKQELYNLYEEKMIEKYGEDNLVLKEFKAE